MIKKLFKKMVGIRDDDEESKAAASFREKTNKFQEFLEKSFEQAKEEYFVIRKKMENLRQTNYDLGLKHLENGHLTDAIFRFRIIKKFWPDLLDAQYHLAYCLLLDKKPQKAKEVLRELVHNHPDYDPKARELLAKIENSQPNAS